MTGPAVDPFEDYRQKYLSRDTTGEGADFAAYKARYGARADASNAHSNAASHVSRPREFLGGVARAAEQGLTFGFGDELNAAVRSTGRLNPETYKQALEDERAKLHEARQDFPVVTGAAEVAGAIAPALLSGGGTLANATRTERLLPLMGRTAAQGAAYGAAYGAGTSEGGPADRLLSGAKGAVSGAVVGGALPAIARGGSRVADALGMRSGRSAEQRAAEIVAARFKQDGRSLQDVGAEAQALANEPRKPEILMDLGGGNVHGLASAASAVPGPAKDRIAKALSSRMEGQGTRLTSDLERGLGVNRTSVPAMIDEMVEARKAATTPLYERAYARGVVDDPTVRQILHKPSMQKAYQRAQQIAAEEGVPLVDITQHPPDVRTIDYIKKGLDDLIDVGNRGGEGGLGPAQQRAIVANKHALLEQVDKLVPEYAQARMVHQSEREMNAALTSGAEVLKQGPDEITHAMSQLGPAEQQVYRRGALSELAQKIESASDRNDATRALWRNQLMRDRLQAIFPDAQSYGQFARLMDREVRMADTRNAVSVGSRTTPLAQEVSDLSGRSLAEDVATGGIKNAALKRILQSLDNRRQGLVGEVGGKVGEILTAGADPAGPTLADALQQLQHPLPPPSAVLGRLRRSLPNVKGSARLLAGQTSSH